MRRYDITRPCEVISIAAAAQVRARERARRLDVDDDVAGAGAAVDADGEIGLRMGAAFAELEIWQPREGARQAV